MIWTASCQVLVDIVADNSAAHKILIADDDEEWRGLIGVWLKGLPYCVSWATTAEQVLPLVEQHRPDCLVLDYRLGDQTALKVCGMIKAKPHLRRIPVIILTAFEQERLRAYDDCEADHFLAKNGLDAESFLAVLRATLRRTEWDRGVLVKGDVRVDPDGRRVYEGDHLAGVLSEQQFIFLCLLLEKAPEIVPYDEIFKTVMKSATPAQGHDTGALRALAHRTRSKLGTALGRRIRNVKLVGWVYIEPSTQLRRNKSSARLARP